MITTLWLIIKNHHGEYELDLCFWNLVVGLHLNLTSGFLDSFQMSVTELKESKVFSISQRRLEIRVKSNV